MHKLRSSLTTLGIIFGVSSVIAMLAIGEGASQEAQAQIARLGSQNVIIKTVKPPEDQDVSGQDESMREYGLTYSDAERFRNSIPNVEVIVPSRLIPQQAWYRNRKVAIEIVGTVPWYPEITPAQIKLGRFLTSIDLHHKQSICVVDEKVVDELFLFDDPLGQDIKLQSDYYRVVGVVQSQSRGAAAEALSGGKSAEGKGQGANVGNIYIPLTTVKNRFGEISIQFSGSSGRSVERVELQEITVKVGSVDEAAHVRCLSLIRGHAQCGIALKMLDRAEALLVAEFHIFDGHIVLLIQPSTVAPLNIPERFEVYGGVLRLRHSGTLAF